MDRGNFHFKVLIISNVVMHFNVQSPSSNLIWLMVVENIISR